MRTFGQSCSFCVETNVQDLVEFVEIGAIMTSQHPGGTKKWLKKMMEKDFGVPLDVLSLKLKSFSSCSSKDVLWICSWRLSAAAAGFCSIRNGSDWCWCVSGDRAEGAEATIQAGLNKLNVAQNQEDSEDEHPPYSDPASSTSSILLLNSIWSEPSSSNPDCIYKCLGRSPIEPQSHDPQSLCCVNICVVTWKVLLCCLQQ